LQLNFDFTAYNKENRTVFERAFLKDNFFVIEISHDAMDEQFMALPIVKFLKNTYICDTLEQLGSLRLES